MKTEEKLIELAKERFGTLTEAEEKLFRAVARGEVADYTSGSKEADNPANAKGWGDERVLAANRIAWLCTDPQAVKLVSRKGLTVRGSRIDGELDLEEAEIPFRLDIKYSALPEGLQLLYCKVRGLYLDGSHTGPILADGLQVEACLHLRFGFHATGEVRLVVAEIGANLDCDQGHFQNPDGTAFACDGLKVKGAVYLRDGFQAEGEVCLLGADIGANLECDNSSFKNPGGNALTAHGLKVKGGLYLRNGFRAKGTVSLVSAEIAVLQICKLTKPDQLSLDLRHTCVGTLWDDADSWPKKGGLLLHGFVYENIAEEAPREAQDRIKWLHRQGDKFLPQPYEQLATVLRTGGQEADAKEILIQKAKDRKRLAELTRSEWWWYHVFGRFIGYGYRPWRAMWSVLLFIVFGSVFFGLGADTFSKTQTGTPPQFNALVYSVDAFVPLVDLHQARYWVPDAEKGSVLLDWPWITIRWGNLLRLWLWLQIIAGWVLSTLLVVGVSGLVRS